MGIEFVDLSEREAAELRGVVEESDEKPQRVSVNFEGTNQVVRARAYPTDDGFQLTTALPFLKNHTRVDIALSPDAQVSAQGTVVGVELDRTHGDGIPRLLIDVKLASTFEPAARPVETAPRRLSLDHAVPELDWHPGLPEQPSAVTVERGDRAVDATRIVAVPARRRRANRVLIATALLGLAGLAFLATRAAFQGGWPVTASSPLGGAGVGPRSLTAPAPVLAPAPVVVPAPVAAAPALVAAPAVPTPAAEEAAADPAPDTARTDQAPAERDPAPAPAGFTVALSGSLAGAHRYALRAPDGVAFNLPHARPATKFGTYQPRVPGVRSVWVRPLPGGGTHLRFFFKPGAPSPRVVLERDGARVFGPG
jgi:hypothetical protein